MNPGHPGRASELASCLAARVRLENTIGEIRQRWDEKQRQTVPKHTAAKTVAVLAASTEKPKTSKLCSRQHVTPCQHQLNYHAYQNTPRFIFVLFCLSFVVTVGVKPMNNVNLEGIIEIKTQLLLL